MNSIVVKGSQRLEWSMVEIDLGIVTSSRVATVQTILILIDRPALAQAFLLYNGRRGCRGARSLSLSGMFLHEGRFSELKMAFDGDFVPTRYSGVCFVGKMV